MQTELFSKGKYSGFVIDDHGERVIIDSLIGFAEDHIARR